MQPFHGTASAERHCIGSGRFIVLNIEKAKLRPAGQVFVISSGSAGVGLPLADQLQQELPGKLVIVVDAAFQQALYAVAAEAISDNPVRSAAAALFESALG